MVATYNFGLVYFYPLGIIFYSRNIARPAGVQYNNCINCLFVRPLEVSEMLISHDPHHHILQLYKGLNCVTLKSVISKN